MRWGVPRCEVLIAVGDQRRERVHMVRVLYHWNLIRLRGRRGVQRETVIKREKRGGERKKKGRSINIWFKGFQALATQLQLDPEALGKRSYRILGSLEVPNLQATVKIVRFVIKSTSAVSPWNSVTQSEWLWGLPVHIWA